MTPKKKKFARLVAEGMQPEAAIIAAGYSASTPADRIRKMLADPAVQALIRRERESPTPKEFSEPEDFMKWLMNDESENVGMRWKAANSLLTAKKQEKQGVKEIKKDRAIAASNKFSSMAPPPITKH